ncbi:hypothetical protein CYMTET_55654 [Cymbomonas tetramitiformis]|uniref:Reverse transcriptase domain-containing protein n=1 Tax=Cymbomonas tetramitiformis TaxID=36881 RepID=A0AAE0BCI9_9CHLO|nr:hypothetical protein CYMTET_55654 [Cymbomonas tetramitiformis]
MGARLVALLKPGGGVRPIACGESLRRLAGKVGDDGEFRWVSSAEGAQQGDPLGPFFMAVALQPALQATLNEHPDVFIMAYLDDIHILGPPDKVRAAYDTIVPLLIAAGLELNVPKSTVFCPDGACPEFDDVVDEAGTPMPGAVVPLPGVKVLGIPVGSDQWVADKCVEMALAAGAILPKLARLDDPQVQLLLLRFCAHPRFMHLVRGVPPHLLAHGALAHDNGIQECLQEVAGSPYPLGEEAVALSQLPTRWGGLGLSSAQRLAPAGWLGSWAQVWGKMVVLFPAVRDMLPHLGAPEDTEVGGHPLAAGLTAAMEDVRGARARVVAALGVGHPVPESLRVPEAAPVWGGFGSSQPTRQKELTNYQHGSDWLRFSRRPFVDLTLANANSVGDGDDGEFRWVSSAEGAQQGDPLGPFFMAVALQPALQATLNEHPDVFIMAYLDDIHILGPPDKVRAAYDTIVPLLIAAGLELNVPKSTVFCPDGACPEFEDVVDEAGTPMPGAVVPLPGVKVLGIPVGSDQWVADKCVEMALAAGAILPKLARLDDPQVQLLLLRFCAHPRFMHLVRGVPPHLLAHGALAHDNGIQECLQEVAGSPYPLGEEAVALSQLPTRWGGLGLSSAQRLAPAGWLGSWAQVWGKMVVLFPAVRDMLPHLGAPEDTEVGGHPLAAGLTAAMEDVRGARARVVAALGVGHSVPESLRVPEAAPVWGGFGSSQPTRQKELTNYQHGQAAFAGL